MKKLNRLVIIAILAIFMGLLSGSYLNSSYAGTSCENVGCEYNPATHEFKCKAVNGVEDCSEKSNGDCSETVCGGGGSDPIVN